jgi:hypothetical protein
MSTPPPRLVAPHAVRGRAAIAATLSDVLGWTPSDQQITRWTNRRTDPLPVAHVLGQSQGEEAAIVAWAERQLAERTRHRRG